MTDDSYAPTTDALQSTFDATQATLDDYDTDTDTDESDADADDTLVTDGGQPASGAVAQAEVPTQAAAAVKDLAEGDVIEVPQYTHALRVTHTGDLNGEANAFIGLEFAAESHQTSADKSLIVNQHSGRVYLTAGTTDKGEVTELTGVRRAGDDY